MARTARAARSRFWAATRRAAALDPAFGESFLDGVVGAFREEVYDVVGAKGVDVFLELYAGEAVGESSAARDAGDNAARHAGAVGPAVAAGPAADSAVAGLPSPAPPAAPPARAPSLKSAALWRK
ncbi:hypothetical protein M885DRAFT_565025 [Pelagophyceae sp. CCMP2097]|nr:hypothetical protein M885DRAFT_565025 [Pelagophyceae sp. CCMP2097]